MFQSKLFHDQPDIARLLRVQETGLALVDCAKTTAAGTDISQNQESGGVVPPALTNIRAARLLTNCVKIMLS